MGKCERSRKGKKKSKNQQGIGRILPSTWGFFSIIYIYIFIMESLFRYFGLFCVNLVKVILLTFCEVSNIEIT